MFVVERQRSLPRRIAVASVQALLALCLLSIAASPQPASDVTLILRNARIFTEDPARPWAEAIAISGEKIVAVGSNREIDAMRSSTTVVEDVGGRLVLPGFTDCHVHFLEGSLSLLGVSLDDAKSVAEIQKRVREYAAAHPNEPWILGRGWSYPAFGTSGLPDRKYLDEVVPDRPVFLEGFDGHTYWANSKALALAGVDKNTPNPPNGIIVRDGKGEPTGALKEAARAVVARIIPKPDRARKLQALRRGLREANKVGLVRVHSAGGDFEALDLYDELRHNGQLSVRFYIAYFLDPPALTQQEIGLIEAARNQYHDDWLATGAVKTMLDGVVESHTAAMTYADTGQTVATFWDPAKYTAAILELDRRGFQNFTHAIGDDAVNLALNAFENAAKLNHTVDGRPRVEHIETVKPSDIPRFERNGVIASMQPLHAYPDEDTLGPWLRGAGKEREPRAFAWRSIAHAGGRLAFGSDWPVVTLNPWHGIQTAVTRQTAEGTPAGGWVPDQRITLEQAVAGYTTGAAYAGRREHSEDSLQPGKLADLIVLSQDLFKLAPERIGETQVLMTIVGGRIVYRSEAWSASSTERDVR